MAFLGVDIGSATTRAALIDEDLHMLALTNVPTRVDGTLRTILECVSAATAKALAQAGFGLSAVESTCFGIPGFVDVPTGRAFAPVIGWTEPMGVVAMAQDRHDVPLVLANDAQVAAMGEANYGAGTSYDRFALVRLGSLIEVTMVVRGRVVESETLPCQLLTEGDFLFAARGMLGEVDSGHMDDTSVDLSGIGLGKIRSSRVMEEARLGNKIARQAVDYLTREIVHGVVELTGPLKPRAVVLSGGSPRDRAHLGRLIPRRLAETRSKLAGIPVDQASLGNDAKPLGAAVIARDNCLLLG